MVTFLVMYLAPIGPPYMLSEVPLYCGHFISIRGAMYNAEITISPGRHIARCPDDVSFSPLSRHLPTGWLEL